MENTCRGEHVNEGRRNVYEAGENRALWNFMKGTQQILDV
jgi:hypothetical protein